MNTRQRILFLEQKHKELDKETTSGEGGDDTLLQLLKKKKLQLKDEIAQLKRQLDDSQGFD